MSRDRVRGFSPTLAHSLLARRNTALTERGVGGRVTRAPAVRDVDARTKLEIVMHEQAATYLEMGRRVRKEAGTLEGWVLVGAIQMGAGKLQLVVVPWRLDDLLGQVRSESEDFAAALRAAPPSDCVRAVITFLPEHGALVKHIPVPGAEVDRDEAVRMVAARIREGGAGALSVGAAVEAVPQEEEHGADSPQKPRGEGLEGDADVVPDVVAEHGHVRITSPLPAETLPLGLVHPLVAGQILGRFDEEGHFGILLDQEG